MEGYTNSQRQGVAFIEVSWETVLAAFLQAAHYPDPALETPRYFPPEPTGMLAILENNFTFFVIST